MNRPQDLVLDPAAPPLGLVQQLREAWNAVAPGTMLNTAQEGIVKAAVRRAAKALVESGFGPLPKAVVTVAMRSLRVSQIESLC